MILEARRTRDGTTRTSASEAWQSRWDLSIDNMYWAMSVIGMVQVNKRENLNMYCIDNDSRSLPVVC